MCNFGLPDERQSQIGQVDVLCEGSVRELVDGDISLLITVGATVVGGMWLQGLAFSSHRNFKYCIALFVPILSKWPLCSFHNTLQPAERRKTNNETAG
ncbi:hypothetical protein Ddc_12458 [Ditylenchus destructor]|nr:hypothetical protein Ddc_12458 [Ditylenchus destructor]